MCLPVFEEKSTRLHTAIKFLVLHQGLVGRLSSSKYFAFHAAAAGLSDRDGMDTLYVVSVLHLGLGNTLVRPGRCIYGHQNMHRKTQYGCFFFQIFDGLDMIHFGWLSVEGYVQEDRGESILGNSPPVEMEKNN